MRSLNRVVITDKQMEALKTTLSCMSYPDFGKAAKKLGVTPKTVYDLANRAVSQVSRARNGEARLARSLRHNG